MLGSKVKGRETGECDMRVERAIEFVNLEASNRLLKHPETMYDIVKVGAENLGSLHRAQRQMTREPRLIAVPRVLIPIGLARHVLCLYAWKYYESTTPYRDRKVLS